MSAHQVGRIAALWRYPVKSMAGEALESADVSWHGLAGDRRWAFVRPGLERSNFPWLTIRERPEMSLHRPAFVETERPDASRTVVRTPSGESYDVVDPALAAMLGEGVRVIKQNRGVFDALPLSLISTASIGTLDVRRFRPNLVVEAPGAFPEDGWVGRTLSIGGLRMRADKRDPRCVLVNVDPDTTERDASILRWIAQERDTCLGVYGSTVSPGVVAVGDPVLLED